MLVYKQVDIIMDIYVYNDVYISKSQNKNDDFGLIVSLSLNLDFWPSHLIIAFKIVLMRLVVCSFGV